MQMGPQSLERIHTCLLDRRPDHPGVFARPPAPSLEASREGLSMFRGQEQ